MTSYLDVIDAIKRCIHKYIQQHDVLTLKSVEDFGVWCEGNREELELSSEVLAKITPQLGSNVLRKYLSALSAEARDLVTGLIISFP